VHKSQVKLRDEKCYLNFLLETPNNGNKQHQICLDPIRWHIPFSLFYIYTVASTEKNLSQYYPVMFLQDIEGAALGSHYYVQVLFGCWRFLSIQ
jgi:hypothetical protein